MANQVYRFSRTNLQSVITPTTADKFGNAMPFLSFLDTSYNRITRSLLLQQTYRIKSDEAGNLPLISFRMYNTVELWWVIGTFNGIVNPFTEVTEGTLIKIPSLSSIEDYFKKALRAKESVVTLV